MEAALRPVKHARPLATFTFRGVSVGVELTDDGAAAAVICPVCGACCQVNLETHEIVVNLRTRKAATIYPSVSCPRPLCGFRVVVVRGTAFEVGEVPKPEEPPRPLKPGEVRCGQCGKPFKRVGINRNRKVTTGRWLRGRWLTVDDCDSPTARICQRCRNGL